MTGKPTQQTDIDRNGVCICKCSDRKKPHSHSDFDRRYHERANYSQLSEYITLVTNYNLVDLSAFLQFYYLMILNGWKPSYHIRTKALTNVLTPSNCIIIMLSHVR